jgi:SAM-dependent methyltransferase
MPTETRSPDPRSTDYDAWGWLYNETMGPKYCQSQLQPLNTLLLPELQPGAAVLDVCCGTGHLVQKLGQKGLQMTGIDSSEAMLHHARQNSPDADFILVDVRSFQFLEQFDAAYSTSASLNHMLQLNDFKLVCQNVFSALKPGGLFLFDVNHHAQMRKWWNGSIAEGEIGSHNAWSITPVYDPRDRTGHFQVTLFQAPHQSSSAFSVKRIGQILRQLLYRCLSPDLRRFRRWRFHILSMFLEWEPDWQQSAEHYAVRGYLVEEVIDLLTAIGFDSIKVCTLNGNPQIDSNHSAYFLCQKPTSAT